MMAMGTVEPLLPKVERRNRHPGRKRHRDRLVFQGILFVLHTGMSWQQLPLYRRLVRALGVKPVNARSTEHGSGLGTQRWVVERTFAHLNWFRRLRIRWEISDDVHEAFLTLACALICWRRLTAVQRRHLCAPGELSTTSWGQLARTLWSCS